MITRLAWRGTSALVRSLAVPAVAGILALLTGQAALLMLALPLALVGAWSLATRPAEDLAASAVLGHGVLTEGSGTVVRLRLPEHTGAETVGWYVLPTPDITMDSAEAARTTTVAALTGEEGCGHDIPLRSDRWGRREIGPLYVGAWSEFGAFRTAPTEVGWLPLLSLPDGSAFSVDAALPVPQGLVGLSRSARRGDGSEFAAIRNFQMGDRLRRIHWGRSTRERELQVRATHAEQDTHVLVLVDAYSDLRTGTGTSTLDTTMRAAVAVSEQMLRRGERVALRVLGTADVRAVPAGSGLGHLRRIQGQLAQVSAGTERARGYAARRFQRMKQHLPPGTLVVVCSALLSDDTLAILALLQQRHITTIVLDSVGERTFGQTVEEKLAWRVRALERQSVVATLRNAGIPVAGWHGPGSLDVVLTQLQRAGRRAAS